MNEGNQGDKKSLTHSWVCGHQAPIVQQEQEVEAIINEY